ncbi:hypothetical protein [Hansschlegelia plantiphila]|uniref:Uncharacterized protein n=1 Tax=Hansschlegelia plantiphila TaxID=374655 RepID=A0A9W6MWY0_9HYPH|nr:hypothetical protein [Hansschlegelia plantiphila]GLK69476.1 hypothetical protein GCM10008179_31140 [Hansschlegelia plantiphila]
MRRRSGLILSFLLTAAAAPAFAQAPPVTTPPDKIDPGPVRPETPAPPEGGSQAKEATPSADTLDVPARVFAVRVAGPWQADGKKGFSRVVGVTQDGAQHFYVQWLGEPDGQVVATKEVVDDEAAKVTFGDVRTEPGDEGVTVFLDTVPDKDGMRDTWVMVIGEPGDVRFGPATN